MVTAETLKATLHVNHSYAQRQMAHGMIHLLLTRWKRDLWCLSQTAFVNLFDHAEVSHIFSDDVAGTNLWYQIHLPHRSIRISGRQAKRTSSEDS